MDHSGRSDSESEPDLGGLATVFPDTASVESDFSVLGWEKDTYRSALTDFSLEGLLHARQFHKLCELCDE